MKRSDGKSKGVMGNEKKRKVVMRDEKEWWETKRSDEKWEDSRIICILHNSTNSWIFFFSVLLNSERNLSTLVKANWLPLLIENCSAGSKLLGSKFL